LTRQANIRLGTRTVLHLCHIKQKPLSTVNFKGFFNRTFIMMGDDRAIRAVLVAGEPVPSA